ncbi:MAG: S41 family peptidase [Candidatus Izimaplasma sp.]|nr:S41 family peptidase [Candidatus Izimaplasma bacterium]
MKKLILIIMAVLSIGVLVACDNTENTGPDPAECENLVEEFERVCQNVDPTLIEVLDMLKSNHYKRPTDEELYQGAIEGMIGALEDPHTTYFDFDEYTEYRSSFGESYVGIGVSVRYSDNLIVVENVKGGGPADGAGILPNDIIAFVNGEDIRENPFFETVGRIQGEVGTEVTIGVIRQGIEDPIHLTMTREVIENPSIIVETFEQNSQLIGYIEVTQFGDETDELFADALRDFDSQNIDGVVIDVRNNGGGHLGTVYYMMNEILVKEDGAMFSTVVYSDGEIDETVYSPTNTTKKAYPIITLVNENSASASEVFASAMKQQGNYQVLGTKTYGKGTMQTDSGLATTEGDSLHISIGKWLTADGDWLHFDGGLDGLEPDFYVEASRYERAYKVFLIDEEPLVYDTVDNRIANIQLILNTMGFDVREDGYFDLETKAAVETIQSQNNLPITGQLNQATLSVINEALDLFLDNYQNDTQLQAAIDILTTND